MLHEAVTIYGAMGALVQSSECWRLAQETQVQLQMPKQIHNLSFTKWAGPGM